jgi:poly(A) polymerase
MDDRTEQQPNDQGDDLPRRVTRPPLDPDQRYRQALKAIELLIAAGHAARLAGGCVRDRLLGEQPKDYDIATDAHPSAVCHIFEQKHMKVVPTGIEHGTVTVVIAGQGIEITTLRKDVSTDGRRATVAFGHSFAEDAARRDFTMNAMYEDHEGQIYDYHQGYEDLTQGRLRFVGDAKTRICEDYLRILRLFRFWARFGFAPDAETLAAVSLNRAGLSIVSQERITAEILSLLSEPQVVPVIEAMYQAGILPMVFKHPLEESVRDDLDAYKSIRKAERSLVRLAALLGRIPKADDRVDTLHALRLSQAQSSRILSLLDHPTLGKDQAQNMTLLDHQAKIWGNDGLIEVLCPAWRLLHPGASREIGHLERLEIDKGARRRTPLPLKGQDLIRKLGLTPGPQLGDMLEKLKESFRNELWTTAEDGLHLARAWLKDSDGTAT